MKLLTRRQVIFRWQNQPDSKLDSYVCPNCRDLLYKESDGVYLCKNCDKFYLSDEEK